MSKRANKILYLVLSLLIAILLWLYVDKEQDNTIPQSFTNIPIEFIGAEDTLPNRNLILTSGEDATLDLRISGPRLLISNLNKDDIRAQVDLSSISAEGRYTRYINIYYPDNVDQSKINLEYQSRSAVTVVISPMSSKTVPVTVSVVNNEVAEGYVYMADKLTSDPSSVTIRGREEDVAPVAAARVVVDLAGASATVRQELGYELLDSEGNVLSTDNIRLSERNIEVTAPVYIIKELPLTVKLKYSPGSMEENTRWSLSNPSITVAGEPASLANVEEISLGEIDLSQILSNTDEQELEIPIPADCENMSGIATTIFSVRFRGLETRTISVTDISAIGLAEGQVFSKVTNSVDVTLRGPASELDEVLEEDVRIVVDLTEFGSGTVRVPARVLVDGHNNEVGAIGSYSITCKISS